MVIVAYKYCMQVTLDGGWLVESGPESETRYRIDHAMGVKSVYYFLAFMDRGRPQTLPLACEVNRKELFDISASGVRHSLGHSDKTINWKDWQYTFNTSCYICHVSQVSSNYEANTDAYHSVWREPGINCETCHGPADKHNSACESAPEGPVVRQEKILGEHFPYKFLWSFWNGL